MLLARHLVLLGYALKYFILILQLLRVRAGMSNPILGVLGNDYCGPLISDGQFQPSVEGYATARSELQQACKEHDAALARNDDWKLADRKFIETVTNLGKDTRWTQRILGRLFGAAVSFRDIKGYLNGSALNYIGVIGSKKDKLLTMAPYSKKRALAPTFNEKLITKPATYGTGVVLQPVVVTRYGNGIKVRGSEFTTNSVAGTTAHINGWKCISLINLNPAYFENSRLGNYCKLYSKFRFTKLRLNYITNVGTSSAGNLLVEYMPSASEVHRNFNSTTFLNQVMGNAGSCLMPIWQNFKVDIPLAAEDSELKYVANETTTDLREVHDGNIAIYAGKVANGTNTGYYVLEYECIFDVPYITPRIAEVPYPSSYSWQYIPLYNTAVATANAAITFSASNAGDFLDGSLIYKVVFDVTSGTPVGGAGTVATVFTQNATVSGGVAGSTAMTQIRDGCTLYGTTNAESTPNVMYLSTTLASAFTPRQQTDRLFYINTVGTTIITIYAWVMVVRGNDYDNQADA